MVRKWKKADIICLHFDWNTIYYSFNKSVCIWKRGRMAVWRNERLEIQFFLFFFFDCVQPGIQLGPPQWKQRVLATGQPGNSQFWFLKTSVTCFLLQYIIRLLALLTWPKIWFLKAVEDFFSLILTFMALSHILWSKTTIFPTVFIYSCTGSCCCAKPFPSAEHGLQAHRRQWLWRTLRHVSPAFAGGLLTPGHQEVPQTTML